MVGGWMDGDRERGSCKGAHYRGIPYSGNASTPGVEFRGKRGTDRWELLISPGKELQPCG